MNAIAAIAFTPAPASNSPNLGGSAKDPLQIFHDLIDLCFSSLRRWNPHLTLVLVTTKSPGPRLERRLSELKAEILLTPFTHEPPAGFYPSFNASLFSIDALAVLAKNFSAPSDRILLLDPDIVCAGSLESLVDVVPDRGFVAYDTGFPPDEVSQGLSAIAAGALHRQLDPSLMGVPRHFGGELYGFTSWSWLSIADKVEEAWQFSLTQWNRKLPRFVTEEHLMNFALRYTNVTSATPFIRRIWTAPTLRTVRDGDLLLPLWHLPAEKDRGLARMQTDSVNHESWFWKTEHEAWRKAAAAQFGIPRRDTKRLLWDLTGLAIRRIQTLLHSRGR